MDTHIYGTVNVSGINGSVAEGWYVYTHRGMCSGRTYAELDPVTLYHHPKLNSGGGREKIKVWLKRE
jgi:hypothetical protein